MLKKIAAIGCAAVLILGLAGCGDFKPHAVTWEDIARTIPANPEYVVSVSTSFEADSALNEIWAKEDVVGLISTGLALDTLKPDHFVVVALPNATFVTWPLPNPREISEKVEDWPIASLNNTVDARILVKGKASLVVSSTQAWVVNNVHGEKYVNEILQMAMNTKAEHTVPFANCIIATPPALTGVVPYEGKYYVIDMTQDEGLLRVDVDAYDKNGSRLDIIDGLGRLPIEFIDQASPISPFAAVQVEDGTMPSLLKRVAKLINNTKVKIGINMIAPNFTQAAGTVVAHWNSSALSVKIPFLSRDAADMACRRLKDLANTSGFHMDVFTKGETLVTEYNIEDILPTPDADHSTPHRHSETGNPSAIAFARVDLQPYDPAELYFELAPSHARLQIDFKQNKVNLAKAVKLIKELTFRVL